jgi:hypothetical protein
VLAAAWLRALERFQAGALLAGERDDPVDAGVAMATSIVRFATEHAEDARFLLTLRRGDLLDSDPGTEFQTRLTAMNAPLETELRRIARALHGRADRRAMDRVTRAVVDIPYAALRRYPAALPSWLEADVAAATRCLLERRA